MRESQSEALHYRISGTIFTRQSEVLWDDEAGVKVGQRVNWEGQQVISGDYHDDTTLGFCLDSPLIIVTWSAGKTISSPGVKGTCRPTAPSPLHRGPAGCAAHRHARRCR